MGISEAVRRAIFNALGTVNYNGATIPVFDEYVNPNVAIPTVNGSECYILIQDQQEDTNIQQTFCHDRTNCNITLRVVTKFKGVGGKATSEGIMDIVVKKIKPTPRTHTLQDVDVYRIQDVRIELSRSYSEFANNQTAINKVTIFNVIVNQ